MRPKIEQLNLSTSSLTFPSFKGDPIIFNNELYPQIQGNKASLREIKEIHGKLPTIVG